MEGTHDSRGFPCESVGEILAGLFILEAGVFIGGKISSRRTAAVMSAQVDVKPLFFRPEFLGRAEMPFTKEGSLIACLFYGLCQGKFSQRHITVQRSGIKSSGTFSGEPVGGTDPARILAGHDTVASWAADGICSIPVRELYPAGCELIDIRSFIEGVRIVCAYVHVAEVINENENVGFALKKGGRGERQKESDFHLK